MKIISKESLTSFDKVKRIDNLNHDILGFPIRITRCLNLNRIQFLENHSDQVLQRNHHPL